MNDKMTDMTYFWNLCFNQGWFPDLRDNLKVIWMITVT